MKNARKLTIGQLNTRIEESDLDLLDVTNEEITLYHTHVDKMIIHGKARIHLRCGSGIDSIDWIHLKKEDTAIIVLHSEGCDIPFKHLPKGMLVEDRPDE